MRLDKLSIVNYKNIEQASLEFAPQINCFCGDNGMGKTNVLDTIFYLARLKGTSTQRDEENLRHGSDALLVKGQFVRDDNEHIEVSCGYINRRKSVKVNGKALRRFSEHVGRVPLVIIAPSNMRIATGVGADRQSFMDEIISQHDADYLGHIMRYDRAKYQRNTMLRRAAEHNQPIDLNLMDALETMMSDDAVVIYERRAAFLEVFAPIFQQVYSQLSNAADEEVSLKYVSHRDRGPLKALFAAGRMKEQIIGYSLYGPHKDDIEMLLRGFPLRREASQGQLKTYFIALKLAQFEYLNTRGRSVTPILLLDDIFDKLDEGRVRKIVSYTIGSSFGQVFITDTSEQRLRNILALSEGSSKLFRVTQGVVSEISQ